MLGAAYVRGLQSAGVHRHPEALRRLLGLARRPATTGRCRWAGASCSTSSCRRSRRPSLAAGAGSVMNSYSDVDGVPAGADPWLLTEVLRDDGASAARSCPTTGPCRSSRRCTASRPTPTEAGAAGAGRRHRRRAARHARLRPRAGRRGSAAARSRKRSSTAPRGGCSPRRPSSACLTLIGRPRRPSPRPPASTSTRRRTGRSPASSPNDRSSCSTPGPRCRCSAPTARSSPGGRRRARAPPIRGRSWGATPSRTTCCRAIRSTISASRSRARSTRCGRNCPTSRSCTQPGCAVTGTTAPGSRPRSTRPATRTCASHSSATGPACSGAAPRARVATSRTSGCPGVQADLLDALLDTGTPVVVVVVSGRPYALGDVAGRAAGLVQAFMPGEEGGPAIAGVLSGRISPGGKLPVQIPRHPGGQPRTYLQPPLGSAESAGISSVDPTPLFPFGFGRSYTSFEIDDLRLSSTEVPTDGEFAVSVRVRNTGSRAGMRSCSSTCTTSSRRSPGRSSSSPDSHGSRSSRARPWMSVSAYMPTAWHIPTAISSGSWNQET